MTDALMDRIKAHRSAPDVYDPPTFDQMADRIEQTEAKLTKAVEFLKTMADYNKYVIAPTPNMAAAPAMPYLRTMLTSLSSKTTYWSVGL